MEGGVAFFLLLIIGVIVVVGGIALYVTGGALLGFGDKEKRSRGGRRPKHETPTSPTQEKVTFAGTEQDERRDA